MLECFIKIGNCITFTHYFVSWTQSPHRFFTCLTAPLKKTVTTGLVYATAIRKKIADNIESSDFCSLQSSAE